MALIWWSNDAYHAFHAQHPIETIDALIDKKEGLVSTGPYNNVLRHEFAGATYYIKRYHRAGSSWIRKWLRSRVRNEWENLIYFARLGIPIPTVLAYGEYRKYGMYSKGYLMTEGVLNAKDLEAVAKEHHPKFKKRQWLKSVMRQVAINTRKLHDEGFTHNDLKWRNILVTLNDAPVVYFFDCPLGRYRYGCSKKRGILKDLATLDKWAKQYLSRTDRLRFYMMYQNIRRVTEKDKKAIKKIDDFFRK